MKKQNHRGSPLASPAVASAIATVHLASLRKKVRRLNKSLEGLGVVVVLSLEAAK